MSEYKRLISYIYNYEKGLKKNNVGFAKIELRNGQCKLSINIKAASLNGKKLKTYLFYREDHKMIQILLVEAVVKNGVFEWKGITNANNIMNTGHSFDEMSGLTLFYSVDKFYATEWDDKQIKLDYLYEWDEVSTNNQSNNQTKNDKITDIEKVTKKPVKVEVKKEPKVIVVPKDEITYMKEIKEAEDAVSKSQEEIVRSILRSIDSGLEIFRNNQSDISSTNTNTSKESGNKKTVVEKDQQLKAAEIEIDNNVKNSKSKRVKSKKEDNKSTNKISKMDINKSEVVLDDETAKLVGYRFINWYRSQDTGFNNQDVESQIVAQSEYDKLVVVSEQPTVEEVERETEVQVAIEDEPETIIEEESEVAIEEESEDAIEEESEAAQESSEELKEELAEDLLDEVAATESCAKNLEELFEENPAFCDSQDEKEWSERLEEAVKKKVSTAERILQKYPAIYPFEDDEILACVRIEPGDIGLFPIENWVLGNNSFLLHGYYNFRHLIFAKKKVPDGEEFILGVPGLYQNREKFMAKMFGFTQFKCTKNVEQKTGEFGYWYIKINM